MYIYLFFVSSSTSTWSWFYSIHQSGICVIGNRWLVTAGVSLGEHGSGGTTPAGKESVSNAEYGFMVRAKHRPWAHPILAVTLGKSWKNFKCYLVVLKLSLILQVFHKCVFLIKKKISSPSQHPLQKQPPGSFQVEINRHRQIGLCCCFLFLTSRMWCCMWYAFGFLHNSVSWRVFQVFSGMRPPGFLTLGTSDNWRWRILCGSALQGVEQYPWP